MRLRDGVSVGLGFVATGLSIFAVGGRPWWAQLAVALVVAAALIPLVASRRVFGRWSPLVVLPALAALGCALQLLPLPRAILATLNPTGVALRDDGAALAGFSPGHTITLDVPGTLDALIFFVTLLGLAIVALRIATSELGRYRIAAGVAGLCTACAIVAYVHRLLDLSSLYGVISDTHRPQLLSPLLNGNQTACLMAVGSALSIGLVLYPRQPAAARAVWVASTLICSIACLMTFSRGGALALAMGVFVAIATLVAQRFVANNITTRRRASFLSSSLPIGIVSVCAVIVVLYASAGGVKDQLAHTSIDELHAPRSKYVAWRTAAELVEESPWVGIGRGAFEPVFQRVHPASAFATYTHLENEYLQAVVDWGIPAALLLALAAIWLVVTALRRWREGPLVAGSLGALAAVVLQSNVDFGISFLGLAAPITVVSATLAYVPLREASPKRLTATRALRVAHVLGLIVGAIVLGSSVATSIADDHLALEGDRARAVDDVARHPFDYYGYARIAETMAYSHDPKAVRLLNHALVLHPTDPGLHVAAARMLYAANHREQAALEYAAALSSARDQRHLLAEIAQRFPTSLAATAIPPDLRELDEWLRTLEDIGRSDIAITWLEHFVLLEPHATHACERLLELSTRHADLDAYDVLKQRCIDFQPSDEQRVALAHVLLNKHALQPLIALLADVESWQGRDDQTIDAWQMLCEAELELQKFDVAKRCLRRLAGTRLISQELAAKLADQLERVDEQRALAAGSGK